MMKRYFPLLLLAGALLLTGCNKNDEETEDTVLDFFAFQPNPAQVKEGESVEVAVYWSKTTPKAGKVELRVTNVGSQFKAEEGVDYTIEPLELNFAADEYVKTVTVTAKQNTIWQNNRSFSIEFESTDTDSYLGYTPGKPDKSSVKVSIIDDDDSVFEGNFNLSTSNAGSSYNTELTPRAGKRGYFDCAIDTYPLYIVIETNPGELEDNDYYKECYRATIDLPQEAGESGDETYAWVAVGFDSQTGYYAYPGTHKIYGRSALTGNPNFEFNIDEYGLGLAAFDKATGDFNDFVSLNYLFTIGLELNK